MQIERHEIRIFSAVVEEGGFSRAADRLNITQSAVSQAVANLEHKLDAQLLLRRNKPELTVAPVAITKTLNEVSSLRSCFALGRIDIDALQ